MSLQAALDSCRAALEGVDEAAIDAPAARLLELLGHQVPDSFESHRVAFLEAFGDALYAEGDEPKVRAAIGRFASQLSLGPRLFEEFGDDWTPVPPPREWLIHSWLPAWRLAMLTGDPGAGKSRLCVQMAVAIACGRSRWLAGEGPLLRLDDPACVVFAKQLPILVIDEAQHLRNDVLEDLRLLTNFAMDSENRLCLLLVGLTELRRRLAMAVHESLSQRLVVRHHLNGLDRDERDHYLTHRLRLAGCELPLFEPCAVEALFQSTRGLPRLINRTAHYALTAAALGNARTVTAEHLEHAVAELRL